MLRRCCFANVYGYEVGKTFLRRNFVPRPGLLASCALTFCARRPLGSCMPSSATHAQAPASCSFVGCGRRWQQCWLGVAPTKKRNLWWWCPVTPGSCTGGFKRPGQHCGAWVLIGRLLPIPPWSAGRGTPTCGVRGGSCSFMAERHCSIAMIRCHSWRCTFNKYRFCC